MLRRYFRLGLLVGLAGGALAAVVKAVQGRTGSGDSPAAEWTPIPDAEPVVVPPPPQRPQASPVVESFEGAAAEAHGDETERQPDSATPDWTPPSTRPASAGPAKAPAGKKSGPTKKAPAKKKPEPWVEPAADACPDSHPVKAKLSSKIFHLPGMLNYARTQPDRCYIDAAAAEADGLRQSKR